MDGCINKTMDRDDLLRPECDEVLQQLFTLMRRMHTAKAPYSSWYGRLNGWPSIWETVNRGSDYEPWPGNPDELRIPWFLLWEIAWLVSQTPIRPRARVLDMGGAGSLFSNYLASRGLEVHAIDLDVDLCHQAEKTAARMGWRVSARQMDMTTLDFEDGFFDHVFSVCVFEHLPVSGRIRCNQEVRRVLRDDGTASYTFDYSNPQSFGRLDTEADVLSQIVQPSGMRLRGMGDFTDCGKRYLETPQCFGFGRFVRAMARFHALVTRSVTWRRALSGETAYTFAAVFLEKVPERAAVDDPIRREFRALEPGPPARSGQGLFQEKSNPILCESPIRLSRDWFPSLER